MTPSVPPAPSAGSAPSPRPAAAGDPLDAWGNGGRLAHILTLLAASIAAFIALATPLGFFWLSYEAELR